MSRSFEIETIPSEAPDTVALCYAISFETPDGAARLLCSAAADAFRVAQARFAEGAPGLGMTCDGTTLTLADLADMAAAEAHGCEPPGLVWSG